MINRFRLVACQLDYIGNLHTDADRRFAIENLPPGLSRTYDEMVDQIKQTPGSHWKLAKRAFQWLLCCTRPVTLRELVVAVVIDPDSKSPFTGNKNSTVKNGF
jgi:hypothetical protein